MIVVDASILAPLVLIDEAAPPTEIGATLTGDGLIAPAHWPAEMANLLLSARRRQRVDEPMWEGAFDRLSALGVSVASPSDWRTVRVTAELARNHALTVYDATYLQLAVAERATLASLDGDLVRAARDLGVTVLTY